MKSLVLGAFVPTRGKVATQRKALPNIAHLPSPQRDILGEQSFHATLTNERRRAVRSRKPFALMLVDPKFARKTESPAFVRQLVSVLSNAVRDTDVLGWYEDDAILGVIFTEINSVGETSVADVLHSRVVSALRNSLDEKVVSKLVIALHLFPEPRDTQAPTQSSDAKIYENLSRKASTNGFAAGIKQVIDVVGSVLVLLLFSPILAAIALLIKTTSKGPIIFKQERMGQFGSTFHCLKFRTMYVNNDSKIHRDYVERLIAGKGTSAQSSPEQPVYKITNDPRVTAIGRFLRRTSLDEFPQFWNVLRGEMSLVGPRPPLPYEFEMYDTWHRRRVLELKPGVTGLWQVSGRSRVCFDDMVRLDLRYAQRWSLWLDLKILIATPLAVIAGSGAF